MNKSQPSRTCRLHSPPLGHLLLQKYPGTCESVLICPSRPGRARSLAPHRTACNIHTLTNSISAYSKRVIGSTSAALASRQRRGENRPAQPSTSSIQQTFCSANFPSINIASMLPLPAQPITCRPQKKVDFAQIRNEFLSFAQRNSSEHRINSLAQHSILREQSAIPLHLFANNVCTCNRKSGKDEHQPSVTRPHLPQPPSLLRQTEACCTSRGKTIFVKNYLSSECSVRFFKNA